MRHPFAQTFEHGGATSERFELAVLRARALADEPQDHRDDRLVELIEVCHDLVRRGALGERREPTDVEEEHGEVDFLAAQIRALGKDALGQRRIDEGAERVTQPFSLLQPGDHGAERRR